MKQPKEKSRMSPVYESFLSLEFNKLGCYICIFFVWMCLYMLNLDEIDILYLTTLYPWANKIISKWPVISDRLHVFYIILFA